MKILLISKSSIERKLVLQQLYEHDHEVHVAKGGLSAISAMGSDSYDFVLVVDSTEDVYDSKHITGFAEKHRIPFLLIQGRGKEVLNELPEEISPYVYANKTEAVAPKCASTLTTVNKLVDTSSEYWKKSWGVAAAHAH